MVCERFSFCPSLLQENVTGKSNICEKVSLTNVMGKSSTFRVFFISAGIDVIIS